MRYIRSEEKMLRADVIDGICQLRFARLDAEKNVGFPHQLAGLFFEDRHLDFRAFLPMLVEAIQIVRQPGRADFQESEAEFGKSERHTLTNHAGELQEDTGGKGVG